jgi:hypothetical protein
MQEVPVAGVYLLQEKQQLGLEKQKLGLILQVQQRYPLPDPLWFPKLGSRNQLGQVDWERL